MTMSDGARSGLTLLVLSLLLVVAGAWGWSAFTEPLPQDEEVPICVDADVSAGTPVTREEVVVSVFNGSARNGLAGSTRDLLLERGFVAGDTGNAPSRTDVTLILASDRQNPAVQLVKRQFKGAKIVPGEGDPLGVGVVVVVGEQFRALRRKQVESVATKADASFCRATGSAGSVG
jgi:hypothetical protein